MDLQSLNKDMLIKLVATIREDEKRKYEEKMKRLEIYEKLANKNMMIYTCRTENCLAILACDKVNHKNDLIFNCKDMFFCMACGNTYCYEHIENEFLCVKCK